MKVWMVLGLALFAAAPADARPKGGPAVAGLGEVIYHADVRAPLPNLRGKPDIFGRQLIVGRIDVRYLGLAEDGRARFQRAEVPIVSNETTVTRAQGLPVLATPMAPVVTDLAVDLERDPTLFVNGTTIRILSADGARVSYEIVE